MTKRDQRALGDYCRTCADLLELRDWTIFVIDDDPGGPERQDGRAWAASSDSVPGQKTVRLRFCDGARDWPRALLRQTVAHELIHAHFAPLVEMWRNDLHPYLRTQTLQLFDAGATRWLEFGVDALADAVAPRLPLITWPA